MTMSASTIFAATPVDGATGVLTSLWDAVGVLVAEIGGTVAVLWALFVLVQHLLSSKGGGGGGGQGGLLKKVKPPVILFVLAVGGLPILILFVKLIGAVLALFTDKVSQYKAP
jgi:hypothetical protein